MKKILGLVVMLSLIVIPALATDNITIPNTFNSGETISSSKMNENFSAIKSAVDNISSWRSALVFNYTDFGSVNCVLLGLEDLSESECKKLKPVSNSVCDAGMPPGCWFEKVSTFWRYNSCGESNKYLDTNYARAIACRNLVFK